MVAELEDEEEFFLPAFAECERCGASFPIEELLMISVFGEEAKITCVRCLLYFLGDFLNHVCLYDDDNN